MRPTKYSDVKCNITELNRSNYNHKKWMDTNYAIRNDEPMIYIMFIEISISAGIHGLVEQYTNV